LLLVVGAGVGNKRLLVGVDGMLAVEVPVVIELVLD
jgi:hypothetical protein